MRDRGKRKLIMYGLMVALMVTTVAYAVLQTTLNINGTVTKKGGSWDIHFANLSNPSLTGDAKSTNANIQATSFTFSATVEKPKDAIVYTFDVVNGGSIDATLDSITLSGATEAKAQDITYTLTYADGKAINKGDKLVSGQTRSLKLTVSYDDVDNISGSEVTLNLGATLIYVQTDETQDSGLNGGVDTPTLTSVTLTDLKNAGKLSVTDESKLYDMRFEGDFMAMTHNTMTITFNSYAKITLDGFDTQYATDIRANFADGSIHEVKKGENVTLKIPVASGSEEVTYEEGTFYYIDGVAQKYLGETWGGTEFTIEGDISTFAIDTVHTVSFAEILIEK